MEGKENKLNMITLLSKLKTLQLVSNYDPMSPKREGPRQQPDPFKLYLISCDWSGIHTHTNRAFTTTCTDPDSSEPPADTIPPQGFQDRISQFRIAQKVSANTSVHPPRTLNQDLRSICPLSHSPSETNHSKLLISSFSPKLLCSITSFLAGSDSFQTQELDFS
jgi:hypothetical protein